MRKIIQICSNYNSEFTNGESLFALCNDGSVWWSDGTLDFGWKRLLDIPQDEPKRTDHLTGKQMEK